MTEPSSPRTPCAPPCSTSSAAGRVVTYPDVARAVQPRRGRVGAVRRSRSPSSGRPPPSRCATVVRLCVEHGVPVVARGAGTGLSGGANAVDGSAWCSASSGWTPCSRSTPSSGYAVVQPGVVNDHLRAAVAELGLWYPPDPASSPWSTIGGNVATNAGGVCCVKYGVTRDYVLELEVVTGTGELVRVGRRTAKGVAGYDLVGAAGRLRGHARHRHRGHRPAASGASGRAHRGRASSARWSRPARPSPPSPARASSRRRSSCSTTTASRRSTTGRTSGL